MDLSFLLLGYVVEAGLYAAALVAVGAAAGLVGLGFAAGWWARGR